MMNSTQRKQIIILTIILIVVTVASTAYNSWITAEMPKVKNMNLTEAITALEEADIIQDNSCITEVVVTDAKGNKLDIDKIKNRENYQVTKQSPKAGESFRCRPGILSQSGKTDLAELTVKKVK
ncbi:MAG: PASTA domain-containing protein [Bacillota bacterium]|nr:PASTA domain-containing protein [Bacillota bacterium]